MNYYIEVASSIELLTLNVNSKIARGWRPIGGPALTKNGFYMQALIKE